MLRKENMMIAGSSALSLYLKQEGIDSRFTPNDLDVWVYYTRSSHNIINKWMSNNNYSEVKRPRVQHRDDAEYYISLSHINTVVDYKNTDGKIVQIIYLDTQNIQNYINEQFDLSCCQTWWNPYRELFETLNPELTKDKKMYIRGDLANKSDYELEDKHLKRIQKYKGRGFTLLDSPCDYQINRDSRVFSEDYNWDTIEVEDIIALEDSKPIKEYLEESEWNIVLKVGEHFYGFHRKLLMNIMKGKVSYLKEKIDRHDKVYDTPFNQSVLQSHSEVLLYADFSIYELVPVKTVKTCGNRTKSLHNINCYNIKDYENTKITNPVVIPTAPPTILRRQMPSFAEGLTIEIPPLEYINE